MSVTRNIVRLSVGDFVAKALNFVAFIHLARALGVESYGVLELAIAIQLYIALIGDAGLEVWATREAARGTSLPALVARVVPLRLLLTTVAFVALSGTLLLVPSSPSYPQLRPLLLLFGLSLFPQALGLKWLFVGRENMSRVAAGLILSQTAFAVAVLVFVRDPSTVLLVPVMRIVGDTAMAVWFWYLYVRAHGRALPAFTVRGAETMLRPALMLGAAGGLALLSFNFDSVMLGLLLDASAVGWYGAAYKPVTVVLAMPVTYFIGIFPAFARTYRHDREHFRHLVTKSLRLLALFAVPIGVCGTFLATPIIDTLFGPEYAASVPAFRVLTWAAVLVILRGTFRQALNAAERQDLDLRCAATATALNVLLNVLLIPRFGIVGAAAATVASEVVWLGTAVALFHRHVMRVDLGPLLPPVAAAAAMAGGFALAQPLPWVLQGFVGASVYVTVLVLMGQGAPMLEALRRR